MERLVRMPFDLSQRADTETWQRDQRVYGLMISGLLREAAAAYEDAVHHGRFTDSKAYARVRTLGKQAGAWLQSWQELTEHLSSVDRAAARDAYDRLSDAWACEEAPDCVTLDPSVFYAELARIDLALNPGH